MEHYTVDHLGEQQYYLYRPARLENNSRVLVSVHGISRNAFAHASFLAHHAETHNALIIAPLFPATQFPTYQRIGRNGKGARADHALNEVLDDASQRTGTRTRRVHLFGYSGGAQFAHRYAMAYPQRVAALVVASAGWYTFPDTTKRYPYGMRASKHLPDLRFDFERFLDLPIHVFVGQRDNQRDDGLNQSPRIDRQQGATRVERAARWASALRSAALLAGRDARVGYRLLPRSDHSFEQNVATDCLDSRIFEAFFGGSRQDGYTAEKQVVAPENARHR